jgi:hypothetical protein
VRDLADLSPEQIAAALDRLEAEKLRRAPGTMTTEMMDWMAWMYRPDIHIAEPGSAPPSAPPAPERESRDAAAPPPSEDVAPDIPPTEFKEIAVQLSPQSETSAGRVTIGWWRLAGRVLTLRFEDERERTRILRADEDPKRVARQMLRADRGDRGNFDFSRVEWPRY